MKCASILVCSLAGLAAAADAFLPGIPTIPFAGEEGGAGGLFRLSRRTRVVVDTRYAETVDTAGETLIPPTLFEFASVFVADLTDTLGLAADGKPVLGDGGVKNSSIFLTLDPHGAAGYIDATGKPSAEGYTLVTSQDGITISGASPLGVWWGTRTLLQQAMLSEQATGVASLPYGTTVDTPGWGLRGMMLDVARHYYPADFLVELCSYISFFKQNVLHLHLSDNIYNNVNYTWEQHMSLYARFRLWTDAAEYPALEGLDKYRNESYDRAEWEAMQTACAARGVTVIPEIEAPGHALVITQWKPELVLDSDVSQLNLSHPEALPTMQMIWQTFLPWFQSKTVSIGADEYKGEESEYNEFVNAMDGFIAAESGKAMRIWGTFPPICEWTRPMSHYATYNASWTNVYQNVSVQHWEFYEDNPYYDYIRNNYSVVNSNDDFYIVNKWSAPGGYLNTINLTKTFEGAPDLSFWRPYIFDQSNASNNPLESEPRVLGAVIPLWNDYGANASVYSEAYYAWRDGIPALADKLWGGNLTEAAFDDVFAVLSPTKIPGQNLDRAIPSRSTTIVDYSVGHGLNALDVPGGPHTIRDASSNHYDAHTDCALVRPSGGRHGAVAPPPALALDGRCSVVTPLDAKGRNYTLSLSLRVDALADPTNATLLTGRDSALLLTPNITLLAGGNYFRLNDTLPLGTWSQLDLVGRGNRTYAVVDGGPAHEFLAVIGVRGNYHHWAEVAIEAPLRQLGGPASQWTGLFGGMTLSSEADL